MIEFWETIEELLLTRIPESERDPNELYDSPPGPDLQTIAQIFDRLGYVVDLHVYQPQAEAYDLDELPTTTRLHLVEPEGLEKYIKWFQKQLENHIPLMVTLFPHKFGFPYSSIKKIGQHAVVATGFSDSMVKYLEPDDPQQPYERNGVRIAKEGKGYEAPLEEFREAWSAMGYVAFQIDITSSQTPPDSE